MRLLLLASSTYFFSCAVTQASASFALQNTALPDPLLFLFLFSSLLFSYFLFSSLLFSPSLLFSSLLFSSLLFSSLLFSSLLFSSLLFSSLLFSSLLFSSLLFSSLLFSFSLFLSFPSLCTDLFLVLSPVIMILVSAASMSTRINQFLCTDYSVGVSRFLTPSYQGFLIHIDVYNVTFLRETLFH